MGTCLENSGEKEFLNCVNILLGEEKEDLAFSQATLYNLRTTYQKLSNEQQERCLEIIFQVLSDDYAIEIYMLSTLLKQLKDERIMSYIVKALVCRSYPLWERLNDFSQLNTYLFLNRISKKKLEEYPIRRLLYDNFLEEISLEMKSDVSYIPLKNRTRKIIIVVSQILNGFHAPTKWLKYVYHCYKNMGYEVECFVCYLPGGGGYWDWKSYMYCRNFIEKSGEFEYKIDDIDITGFNFTLGSSDYIEQLNWAVKLIWEKRPEFVLEIGSETILAGLCTSFTTVVTMGCTQSLPVTNAPIIAMPREYTQEEQRLWESVLESGQIVLEVKHNIHELDHPGHKEVYTKEIFGMPENAFVIVLAGNSLDYEIKEDFLLILERLLEQEENYVIAVMGECETFQKKIVEIGRTDRVYFLGYQTDFKGAIAVGDIFLNPPRQGGGTGGLFAIMEEVPVITLGNCDVQANVGDAFVCNSLEEMPALVYKYFSDQEFMMKQKENCRKRAAAHMNIDGKKNFQKLCDTVRECALKREEDGNDTV